MLSLSKRNWNSVLRLSVKPTLSKIFECNDKINNTPPLTTIFSNRAKPSNSLMGHNQAHPAITIQSIHQHL